MKIIDLSTRIENNCSEVNKIEHTRLNGKDGAKYISKKSGIDINNFPNQEFLTLDTYKLNTHMGTHVDAPIHYGHNSHGCQNKSIDEIPLDWFIGDAKKLDFTKFPRKKNIEKEDILKALDEYNLSINPGDIILIWTGMGELYGTKEYFSDGPGLSQSATKYLLTSGVKVIGIDAFGLDRSFPTMIDEFNKNKDKNILWPSHFLGRDIPYIQVEKLINLDKVPSNNFKVVFLPLKLVGGDASWIRAIAILE
ncbi:Kynurenine formamidase (plasmid) [Apilactobacillus kunkeei]|uniref:cyclase family protein n=1 Tax=Apilactobacillus waqarii TaxID=2851006 RepID=UPI0021E1EB4B|nr:Kynurenine formamidase [Apilactobacillus kunkeei]CAI2673299.1 Kynurenine formamidase [Apilactobacillus kunkeei]CAI2673893.1 Kynurenine formamidase [Apilactobacillus kunkeei]CAI2675521.1 Kynurenine formamidase [Apilactobacillus kunkeei]CAI2675688.1 Kynurenine formamidase [Apilactobacillus kunkeei]